MSKTINDTMICPHCRSNNTYILNDDETLFQNNVGQYSADCYCEDCSNEFRFFMKFTYDVTYSKSK